MVSNGHFWKEIDKQICKLTQEMLVSLLQIDIGAHASNNDDGASYSEKQESHEENKGNASDSSSKSNDEIVDDQ